MLETRDIDIRKYLHKVIVDEFKEEPDTVVIDELNLCQGDARIDIAVVNGSMHGYEIKSDRDTLERLPKQIEAYNLVMDTVTIVAGKNHIKKIRKLVPKWWGICAVEMDDTKKINIKNLRSPKKNKNVDSYSIAQLLWRDEALSILKELGFAKGVLSKPRRIIWERLAKSLSQEELKFFVRNQLKSRKNWRAGQL